MRIHTATLTAGYNEFPGTADDGYVNVPVVQTPSVSFTSHTNGQTVSNSNITVTWQACSNATQTTYSTQLNGVTLTTTQTATITCQGYPIGNSYSASGTLESGANTVVITACDALGCGNASITVNYSASASAVSVTPDGGTAPSITQGTSGSYGFKVRNTGGQPATASFSFSCSTQLTSCSVAPASAAVAAGDSTTATVSYTGSNVGTGRVSLTAAYNEFPGVTDSGYVAVQVDSSQSQGGAIAVAVVGRNPGTTIDRSSCLTIAIARNAAYECGDLRVVHVLPVTVTMDRTRGPTLIYNSRHANPGALVAADVTYSGATPTTLSATVTVPGQSDIVRNFQWNPACGPSACRIVVPISTTQPTGLYAPTLIVTAMSGATTLATSAPVTDTVIVVNRASSPFGAGWWVEGLESLITVSSSQMLWVGGDGSSRLYTQTADPTVYTVAPAYDRPDTLKRMVSSQTWRRQLGDSAYVEFNNSGQHIHTVNALGWNTTFGYSSGLLSSITLPVPASSSEVRQYNLLYTASLLDSVRAPTASFARTTRIAHDASSRITSVTDPDGSSVGFGYDALNRLTSRRNRLGDTTYFAFDSAGALRQSSLSMARTDGPGTAITTKFRAAETRSVFDGSDLPAPIATVYSRIDGPRTDVADTTTFFVNRWGAPDTVTNALGQRTRLERSAAAFPALVTRTIAPNGFETRAFYNARGLTDSTVAVNPYGNSQNATTKYTWNPLWN